MASAGICWDVHVRVQDICNGYVPKNKVHRELRRDVNVGGFWKK